MRAAERYLAAVERLRAEIEAESKELETIDLSCLDDLDLSCLDEFEIHLEPQGVEGFEELKIEV